MIDLPVGGAMNLKSRSRDLCEKAREDLVDLSRQIHASPELGFEERKASGWVSEILGGAGFAMERGAAGMPTAFVARAGSGPLHVAICAEYDALPGIGHACGHNIIAAMAAGAGIALAPVADEAGLTVSVVGTPAEEVGNDSGKIRLLECGVFDGVHAAMMVHPAPFDALTMNIIAASMFEVRYTGKEAHASAFPELGINAADALTVAQVAIGLLRQHILQTDRIHGIITKGGEAPNVVPAHTAARYIIRSASLAGLGSLRARVYRCFEAGAAATGAGLEIAGGDKPYAEMHQDAEIAAVYRRNAESLGRSFPDLPESLGRAPGSTDMGNVSLAVPSIHPMIGIDAASAVNHQPEFTACCATESADRAVFDGALAMAWTAIDLAQNETLRSRLLRR
jgi:amidohydrolase